MSSAKVSSRRSAMPSSWIIVIGLLGVTIAMLAQLTTVVSGAADAAATIATSTAKSQVSDEALEKALNDKRYLMRQLKCALGEVPCDPVGKRLKSLAPFVLRGACPQCTPDEMTQIKKTLAHLQRNFPAEWNKLVQTYAG